jgi:hypothetical protein
VTTDGTTVVARQGSETIAEDSDAGAVLQTIFDQFEPWKPTEAGRAFLRGEAPMPGHHIRFGRGTFPFRTQAETTGANGFRITGTWFGTNLRAEKRIQSYFSFQNPPEVINGHRPGPQIGHLQYRGNNKADYFVTFENGNRGTAMEHVLGMQTREAMIYASPVEYRQNFDNARFFGLRSHYAPLAILEGAAGSPADIRFVHCASWNPDNYAMILRNARRVQVDRFYGGLHRDGKGVVLLENPPNPDFQGNEDGCAQCQLNMIEMENVPPEGPPAQTVHVRVPEGSTTANSNHHVTFPRASPRGQKLLTVDGRVHDGRPLARDITIRGTQLPLWGDPSIDLVNTADCHVDVRPISYRGTPAQATRDSMPISIENGRRNTINGLGTNAGDPRETGAWNDFGYEHVAVFDETTEQYYRFIHGEWRPVADFST